MFEPAAIEDLETKRYNVLMELLAEHWEAALQDISLSTQLQAQQLADARQLQLGEDTLTVTVHMLKSLPAGPGDLIEGRGILPTQQQRFSLMPCELLTDGLVPSTTHPISFKFEVGANFNPFSTGQLMSSSGLGSHVPFDTLPATPGPGLSCLQCSCNACSSSRCSPGGSSNCNGDCGCGRRGNCSSGHTNAPGEGSGAGAGADGI